MVYFELGRSKNLFIKILMKKDEALFVNAVLDSITISQMKASTKTRNIKKT
jgi:hypothetical protein